MPTFFIPNEGKPIDFSIYDFNNPDEDGLICVGANFHPQTLVNAYMTGLFPWFVHDGFPYWYCPDPRMVLFPDHLHISKSMRQVFSRDIFTYTCDTAFDEVMRQCAHSIRKGSTETWINDDFISAYSLMHKLGFAHSFEAWQGETLVGGLYGIAIGEVFFGESMFANATNASKAAFIKAVRFMQSHDFKMIDCQVGTDHLHSLGAINFPRSHFLKNLQYDVLPPALNQMKWTDLFNEFLVPDEPGQ